MLSENALERLSFRFLAEFRACVCCGCTTNNNNFRYHNDGSATVQVTGGVGETVVVSWFVYTDSGGNGGGSFPAIKQASCYFTATGFATASYKPNEGAACK
jgi:hypothetical protein